MSRKVVNGALATRRIAVLALVANTVLWGSYQAVTRDIVQRMPPLDFAVAEQASLLPCILVLLVLTRRQMTARVIRAGLLSGALLAAVVLLTMMALRYTTASEAAFFPAFNGLFAALIARVLLGTAVHRYTWGAAALAVIGALLLAGQTASSGERLGDALAFAGAFVYTGYVFRVDRDTGDSRLPAVP